MTDPGGGEGGDLSIRIAGERTTIRLRPGARAAAGTVRLAPPIRPDDITEARLTLTRREQRIDVPFFPGVVVRGTASITRIEVRYDGGGDPEDVVEACSPRRRSESRACARTRRSSPRSAPTTRSGSCSASRPTAR